MKLYKKILIGIAVLFLLFASAILCYWYYLRQNPNHVWVVIPDKTNGRVTIFFNDKRYPKLPIGDYGYYATINKVGMLKTATSLINQDTAYFHISEFNRETGKFYKDSSIWVNYSGWYSGKITSNLNEPFKNKEFYVAFYYRNNDASHRDSLTKFLKNINAVDSSNSF